MKKKLLLLCVGALAITLAGCKKKGNTSSVSSFSSSSTQSTTQVSSGKPNSSATSATSSSSAKDDQNAIIPDKVRIHFTTETHSLDSIVFWFWTQSYKPEVETLPTGKDDFGLVVEIDTAPFLQSQETELCFLAKQKGSWSYQTCDITLSYGDYTPVQEDNIYVMELYANALTKSNVEISEGFDPNAGSIVNCNFETEKKIFVSATKAMKTYSLYAYTKEYFLNQTKDDSKYLVASGNLTKEEETITLDNSFTFKADVTYKLRVSFQDETNKKESLKTVDPLYLFKNGYELPVYNGNDLGLTFDSNDNPVFKVFAPTSPLVEVNVYTKPHSSKQLPSYTSNYTRKVYDTPKFTIPLNYDPETGIHSSIGTTNSLWDTPENKQLWKTSKLYYTFTAYNQSGKHEVMDPYATTSGLNSERAMIIKMDDESMVPSSWGALPKVWDKDSTYDIESPCDLVISEQHIRDLTMSDTWTDNEQYKKLKGTYKGFYQTGTTYTKGNKTVKTGFDHLEEYGVNAIQLQPIYDQDNNESKDIYNWGYNPLNYNVVEGQYSSNKEDPKARVYELRELVAKYANNKNHTRIIMDVVYNHVSRAQSSNFECLVPGYYFRTSDEGDFLDNTGCGNEVRSEAPMMRKFIVDSLCHWAKDYLIKGFRFDLMAVLDKDTLKACKEALYEIDPDIVIYGEGWDATGAYYNDPEHANASASYSSLYDSETSHGQVGAFNDSGRDAIRGANSLDNFYGFISQGTNDLSRDKVNTVADMIKGAATNKGANPYQTINYASCHDNFTLFDQLNYSLSEDGGVTEPDIETVARASVAVNGVILLSNGVSFINGGEEIFRTKIEEDITSPGAVKMYDRYITHNSYKSSDKVNAYDYSRKVDLKDYFDMYVSLIKIRKNLKVIPYPDNFEDKTQIDTWDTNEGTTISTYRIGKDGKKYHFFINGRSSNSQFGFDSANGKKLFTNGVEFSANSNGLKVSSKYAFGVYTID